MKMKFLILSALLVFFAAPVFSQTWMTDYDEAMAKAVEEEKHVLLFFTGSDWCPPCKKIKKEIYNNDTFISYADENLILVVADFPKRKANKLSPEQEKKNQKLARDYGTRGFPTTIILDTEGQELERWVGFKPGNASDYVNWFSDVIKG